MRTELSQLPQRQLAESVAPPACFELFGSEYRQRSLSTLNRWVGSKKSRVSLESCISEGLLAFEGVAVTSLVCATPEGS